MQIGPKIPEGKKLITNYLKFRQNRSYKNVTLIINYKQLYTSKLIQK